MRTRPLDPPWAIKVKAKSGMKGETSARQRRCFSPLIARAGAHRSPVDLVAFGCVKLIVIRSGSARLFSEFGRRHVKDGDVVLLAAQTLCGAGPEGSGRSSATLPVLPRHRQFTPLRVEARHLAQLIRDDPARQWTVLELVDAVHLSPTQLRRVLVEAFGKAPVAYLTMVRIERMAQLLRSTTHPVKQIAAKVGWRDADFAARQFRRGLGVTPMIYRQFVCASDSDDDASSSAAILHGRQAASSTAGSLNNGV